MSALVGRRRDCTPPEFGIQVCLLVAFVDFGRLFGFLVIWLRGRRGRGCAATVQRTPAASRPSGIHFSLSKLPLDACLEASSSKRDQAKS